MLFDPIKTERWYRVRGAKPVVPEHPLKFEDVVNYKNQAQSLFERELRDFDKWKRRHRSEQDEFLERTVHDGTLADRISSYVVMVQESPIHRLSALDGLLELLESGRRPSKEALTGLEELFVRFLLPPWVMPPLNSLALDEASPTSLVAWYFGSELSSRYGRFLNALEEMAGDTVEHMRRISVQHGFELLQASRHAERRLAMILANKLGDPSKKIASSVSHDLIEITKRIGRPAFTQIIVGSVRNVAMREGVSHRARFYAAVTLGQMPHSNHEIVATLLATTHLQLFTELVQGEQSDDDPRHRILGHVLRGLEASLPHADLLNSELAGYAKELFKLAEHDNFRIAMRALSLISHMKATPVFGERFYRVLYASLLRTDILTTKLPTILLNIVFRALVSQDSTSIIASFLKRLFLLALQSYPALVCAILVTISELAREKEVVFRLLDQPTCFASPDDDDDDAPDEDEAIGSSKPSRKGFLPLKRDPRHTQAETDGFPELAALMRHHHPTVAVFATQLANSLVPDADRLLEITEDPLAEFSLSAFLNHLVHQRPKKLGGPVSFQRMLPEVTTEMPEFESDDEDDIDLLGFEEIDLEAVALAPSDSESEDDADTTVFAALEDYEDQIGLDEGYLEEDSIRNGRKRSRGGNVRGKNLKRARTR